MISFLTCTSSYTAPQLQSIFFFSFFCLHVDAQVQPSELGTRQDPLSDGLLLSQGKAYLAGSSPVSRSTDSRDLFLHKVQNITRTGSVPVILGPVASQLIRNFRLISVKP
ncbi:hypothetical protein XENORESO_007542 [Xenotaenia resolanae]|uniref:Uncharacterized protein n=1 Tax=Xenotaenia resolanae TaxID=208358 RepID=A0ABV0X330_9TELE